METELKPKVSVPQHEWVDIKDIEGCVHCKELRMLVEGKPCPNAPEPSVEKGLQARLNALTNKLSPTVPTELDKAVRRWVEAKQAQVLREDTKGELESEVRKQEQDVEAAIYEEFENQLGVWGREAK